MTENLSDLQLFAAVAKARGFREAARVTAIGASTLSEAVRRLEGRLGVRLLHRTTRSVTPTEAGSRLIERLAPALDEVEAALEVVRNFKGHPAGKLRLNVPVSAAQLVLPQLLPRFLAAYPDITAEIVIDDGFVDVLASGCDAGIRYDERLEQDMIAVPIGPRVQRFAAAAAPDYLARHGWPAHPSDLIHHSCLLARFASGALTSPWEFERDGEVVRIEPKATMIASVSGGVDLLVEAAAAGTGVIFLFEDWLRAWIERGALVPILEDWWQAFPGPYLYYADRRLVPPPLRAFIDFIGTKAAGA